MIHREITLEVLVVIEFGAHESQLHLGDGVNEDAAEAILHVHDVLETTLSDCCLP